LPHGLIVLGHNFDSVDKYRKSVQTGGKRLGPTWKNLQTLFDRAGIDVADCFLTNFFMGCGPDRTGSFPGSRDAKFIEDCLTILGDTIRLLQPRTLLVLGGQTRRHLARLSPALAPWQTVREFADLDERNLALMEPVHVADSGEFSVVNIVHPGGWTMGGNQSRRRFEGLTALAAETALVRRAFYGE
jgi:uracil-DNA glycosylase